MLRFAWPCQSAFNCALGISNAMTLLMWTGTWMAMHRPLEHLRMGPMMKASRRCVGGSAAEPLGRSIPKIYQPFHRNEASAVFNEMCPKYS